MNKLIQAVTSNTVNTINDALLQYGILGALALLLSYFAYNQFKRLTERNEKLEQKVDTLQKEMMKLIVEEKEKLSQLVAENTKALNELRGTIIKFLLESE